MGGRVSRNAVIKLNMTKILKLITEAKNLDHPKKISESIEFIKNNHSLLSGYSGVEDFVIDAYDYADQKKLGIIHHLVNVRARLARKLWQAEIFIGVSVLDDLLFSLFRHNSTEDPIVELLNLINNYGLHHPGFVIYPIHSFGILGLGLGRFFTEQSPYFVDKETGIAISPQSNSKKTSIEFIEGTISKLKLVYKLPYDLLEHFLRSRSLDWFEKNPLLITKVNSFTDGYYENQFLITTKLRLTTSLIYLLSSLSNNNLNDKYKFTSSSSLNNYQTLDINHYLVFQKPINGKKAFNLNCIPMNISQPELVELSDLNIEINPKEWKERNKLAKRIKNAIRKVQNGYFANCITNSNKSSLSRVYNKIYTSLKYFKRSHKSSLFFDESVINLAMAFEILLTDYYAAGVFDRLINILSILLKGVKGKQDFIDSIKTLFQMRGSIVHTGTNSKKIDLQICYKAYAIVFIQLVEIIPDIMPKDENEPIKYVIDNK